MPGYDQSGPMGNGPMSGGGRGVCGTAAQQRGFRATDSERRAGGRCRRGLGKAAGGRFGRGFKALADPSENGQQVNEKLLLEEQVQALQQSLTRIHQKLSKL